jgi:hypothetical protein
MPLIIGNHSAMKAKKAVKGTMLPVLVSGFSNNIGSGKIIENLAHPEGNMTGVRIADSLPKALDGL